MGKRKPRPSISVNDDGTVTPNLPCEFKAGLGCGICIFEILCTEVNDRERGSRA